MLLGPYAYHERESSNTSHIAGNEAEWTIVGELPPRRAGDEVSMVRAWAAENNEKLKSISRTICSVGGGAKARTLHRGLAWPLEEKAKIPPPLSCTPLASCMTSAVHGFASACLRIIQEKLDSNHTKKQHIPFAVLQFELTLRIL